MYFDMTYVYFVLPALLLASYAQMKVQSTFSRYEKVSNRQGYTGAQVARMILDRNGLNDVAVEQVNGRLSDHYDPRKKVVRLSQSVYNSTSVAAVGVAAHETGHAIQHSVSYTPLVLRNAIIPVTNVVSNLSFPLILLGLLFSFEQLIYIGIIFFGAAVVVQFITLPVEFNASKRALAILGGEGILTEEELGPTKQVLSAAAFTYVAATVVAIMQLLRLVALFGRRNNN